VIETLLSVRTDQLNSGVAEHGGCLVSTGRLRARVLMPIAS
jgi:hypothetical protein